MRLGVDAREIQNGVYTGIGRALYNFLNFFTYTNHNDRCVIFSSKKVPFSFGDRVVNHVMSEDATLVWDQVQLPIALARNEIEVFYSPYYKLPLTAGCRKVCAVLDLIYLQYPPYRAGLGGLQHLYYSLVGSRFLAAADRVLTCSYFSKDEIQKFYGIPSRKIEVIPLSVASFYRPEKEPSVIEAVKTRFGITGPYLLYAGNFKPHKNVGALVEAFRLLAGQFPDLKLVLEGSKDRGYASLSRAVAAAGLDNRVVFTGRVDDGETSRLLYAGARVFVMPSVYEGFGLPPVEAMACGVPVVSSNASSLPEAVAGGALLVDASKPSELAIGIVKVLTSEELRRDLLIRGHRRVVDLEETKIAMRMYELFRQVAREG